MLIAADNLDKLLCVEIRRQGLPRGFKWPLYELARSKLAEPMVIAAARLLDRPPARVALVTGAAVPDHMPRGENDGPFGAAVMARALHAIGHETTVVTDPDCAEPIQALLDRYALPAAVTTVSLEDHREQDAICEAFDLFVAIERLGGNVNGILHGVTGVPRTAHRANLDHLFASARAAGKPTIGIGDGGNEIGFGNIHRELSRDWSAHAAADRTPCGGGIFTVVETDVLVVASTSNLGAYGVVAGLALLRGDPSLCHTAEDEVALHHVGVGLGLTDGATGTAIPWCDGISAASNAAFVRIMHEIVEQAVLPPRERDF